MHEFPQNTSIQSGRLRLRIITGFIALLMTAAGGRAAAQVVVQAAGAREEVHVSSLRAQRDAGVVKQGFDYSCGAAALATLLTYGLNDPVGEDTLLRALLEPLSPDQLSALQKKGLSLLDLQRLAQIRGHKAQGFRIGRDQLARLSYPVIVFIRPHGYRHFAVFKGVRGDRVYLADPSLGNVRMPMYRFLDMWANEAGQGIIFAVERKDGSWPDHFALRLPGETGPPIEVLSAAKMRDIGVLVLPLTGQGGPN
jgi:predicted double-glycine peptidase